MKKKQFEVGMTGLVLGVFVGILLGVGELNWIKKSQRGTMAIPVIAVTVFITAIAGYNIGSGIGKKQFIEERTGIKYAQEGYYKEGRYWVGITQWTDKRGNQTFKIKTERVGGTLCSSLNGRTFRNYGIPNANQQTVPRYHKQTVNEVFTKLIDSFKEGQPQELVL